MLLCKPVVAVDCSIPKVSTCWWLRSCPVLLFDGYMSLASSFGLCGYRVLRIIRFLWKLWPLLGQPSCSPSAESAKAWLSSHQKKYTGTVAVCDNTCLNYACHTTRQHCEVSQLPSMQNTTSA